MLPILIRVLFAVFVMTFATYLFSYTGASDEGFEAAALRFGLISILIASVVVVWEWRFQRNLVRELVAVIFGIVAGTFAAGLLLAIALLFMVPHQVTVLGETDLSQALINSLIAVQIWIPILLASCLYIGITVVLQTRGDFRFLVPYIDFSQRGTQEGGILLDTSAVIDGRILDVARTQIISAPLIIPDYVVRELQTIADSSDKLKRDRGRRGLDMLQKLRKLEGARVVIRETEAPVGAPVDKELVRTAKELNGRILTTDFNLNKVSQLEGITVINLNDLSNALKPVVLPGEELRLKVIREGQEQNQGVGYLDDGTMVVVEFGRDRIGQEVDLVITGSIQTSAGRMIFGRPIDVPSDTVRMARRQREQTRDTRAVPGAHGSGSTGGPSGGGSTRSGQDGGSHGGGVDRDASTRDRRPS